MSDDDFDRVFGQRPAPPPLRASFVERVTRSEPIDRRAEPRPSGYVEAAIGALAGADYRAFGSLPVGSGPRGCEVRRWLDATEIPQGIVFPYRLLLRIDFTGEDDLRITLPETTVVLSGVRLEPLRIGLMREQVSFIQQYSARVWPGPPPPGEPLVRAIDILRGAGP